ncbi:tola protein [Cystoisospora suis]|uniref:Tola protein n=1 Tax=Cystoisospora suis TaxID=483139 RepID=A0A2C6KMZ3_9APIC|nr:tola protein [Cystoisospora suis]
MASKKKMPPLPPPRKLDGSSSLVSPHGGPWGTSDSDSSDSSTPTVPQKPAERSASRRDKAALGGKERVSPKRKGPPPLPSVPLGSVGDSPDDSPTSGPRVIDPALMEEPLRKAASAIIRKPSAVPEAPPAASSSFSPDPKKTSAGPLEKSSKHSPKGMKEGPDLDRPSSLAGKPPPGEGTRKGSGAIPRQVPGKSPVSDDDSPVASPRGDPKAPKKAPSGARKVPANSLSGAADEPTEGVRTDLTDSDGSPKAKPSAKSPSGASKASAKSPSAASKALAKSPTGAASAPVKSAASSAKALVRSLSSTAKGQLSKSPSGTAKGQLVSLREGGKAQDLSPSRSSKKSWSKSSSSQSEDDGSSRAFKQEFPISRDKQSFKSLVSQKSGIRQKSPTSGAPRKKRSVPKKGDIEDVIGQARKAVAARRDQVDQAAREKFIRETLEQQYGDQIKQLTAARDELQKKLAETTQDALNQVGELKKQFAAKESAMQAQSAARIREAQQRLEDLEKDVKEKMAQRAQERAQLEKEKEALKKQLGELREKHRNDISENLQERQRASEKSEEKIQSLTETIQALTTSVAQLQELSDVSRSALQAMEEKNKLATAKLEIMSRKDADLEKEMRRMMPTREAKRLAFRALQKGRAVEMFFQVISKASSTVLDKAWAMSKMAEVLGPPRDRSAAASRPFEDRLMQFRKEQMFLMAENERLMGEVSRLQEIVAQNKSLSLVEDPRQHNALLGSILGTRETRLPAARWLASTLQQLFRSRLAFAFSVFQATVLEEHRDSTVQSLQDRFNEMRLAAYSDMMRKIAATKIFCDLRILYLKAASTFLGAFMVNAGIKAAIGGKSRDSRMRLGVLSEGDVTFHPPGAAMVPRPAAGEVQRTPLFPSFRTADGQPLPLPAYTNQAFLDTGAPVAVQPYYYGQLPSVQRRRAHNMFVPMREKPLPPPGYLAPSTYMDDQMTLGVPLSDVKSGRSQGSGGVLGFPVSYGTRLNTAPKKIPSGPYSADGPKESVDKFAGTFRMRTAQQDLQKSLWCQPSEAVDACVTGRVLQ